jgi:hypothetical protein
MNVYHIVFFHLFFSFHRGQGKDWGVLKKKNIFLPGEPQLTGEKALNTPSVTPYNIFSPPYLYFTFLSPPSWLNMFQVAPPGRRWAILILFFFFMYPLLPSNLLLVERRRRRKNLGAPCV